MIWIPFSFSFSINESHVSGVCIVSIAILSFQSSTKTMNISFGILISAIDGLGKGWVGFYSIVFFRWGGTSSLLL